MGKKDSTPLINVTIPKPQIYSLKWGTLMFSIKDMSRKTVVSFL